MSGRDVRGILKEYKKPVSENSPVFVRPARAFASNPKCQKAKTRYIFAT